MSINSYKVVVTHITTFSGDSMANLGLLGKTALKLGLGGVCAYELAALSGGPLPTITKMVHSHRDTSQFCRVAVWASLGALAWHLLVEKNNNL
jgi:hypothetical protein